MEVLESNKDVLSTHSSALLLIVSVHEKKPQVTSRADTGNEFSCPKNKLEIGAKPWKIYIFHPYTGLKYLRF